MSLLRYTVGGGWTKGATPSSVQPPPDPDPPPASARAYGPDAVWNIPASAIARDTANEADQVGRLIATCGGNIAISTNVPGLNMVYYADASTPRMPFVRNTTKPQYQGALYDTGDVIPWDPAWPAPLTETGDRAAVILETDTGREWNLMGLYGLVNGAVKAWRANLVMSRAQWPKSNFVGGANPDLNVVDDRPPGQPHVDWPYEDWRTGNCTSSHAPRVCNIPLLAGLVTKQEWDAGLVEHAISFLVWKFHPSTFRSPAWKAHNGETTAPGLGVRFTLDLTNAEIDECIETCVHTDPTVRRGLRGVVTAMRDYGVIGTDGNYNSVATLWVEGSLTGPDYKVSNIGAFNQTFFTRADIRAKWKLLAKSSAYSSVTTWPN